MKPMSGLKKSGVFLLILLLIAASGIISCDSDNGTDALDNDSPPTLPPQSSFVIDFGEFPLAVGKEAAGAGTESFNNWQWSATNVYAWNTLLTITLAVPVASYIEAFKHEPVQQSDGTWIWAYSFTAQGKVHTAELHALLDNEGVQWDMYISKQGDYTLFHWYTGRSNPITTDGTWTLYRDPDDPEEFLDIEWDHDFATATGDTKYINVIPDDPENGGYIHYGTTAATPNEAFYEIYSQSKDNLTTIEWSRTTKAGRVQDIMHFGDNEWHCWNTSLEDTVCVQKR